MALNFMVLCVGENSLEESQGECGFVRVRKGNHLQCPETGVNHSKLEKPMNGGMRVQGKCFPPIL